MTLTTATSALFDQMNRTKERSIQARAYDGAQVLQPYGFGREVYDYDSNSRLTSTTRDEDARRDAFIYNDAGELTGTDYGLSFDSGSQTWVNRQRYQTFTPDLAGNREAVNDDGWQTIWGSNSLNQYLNAAGNTVSHGSQHEITAHESVSYQYLADGQLRHSTSSNGTYELGSAIHLV